MVVSTSSGAFVETVVRCVSGIPGTGEGGSVTSVLVVVTAISAVEILAEVVVLAVVVVAAADVEEVTTGCDVSGR